MLRLRIVASSASWIVVDKPAGFHTHPPEDPGIRANPARDSLLILRRQLGENVSPVHRLDRAASGLLLFSRSATNAERLHRQWREGTAEKFYFAVARGGLEGIFRIDQPLKNPAGSLQPSVTEVAVIYRFRLPIPHPRGGERSFSLIRACPRTGRFHQIRRHLAEKGFPLLGCGRHGDKRLNREFARLTGCTNLFLRCMRLSFDCPDTGRRILLRDRWSRDWHRLFDQIGYCPVPD